ncbi:MAG: 50S ribosomal protein L27 [bacterium]
MAHIKAGGSVKTGRDSHGQRLGIKMFAGQKVQTGNILVRQKGMNFYPGKNVAVADDHTLFSTAVGVVKFYRRHKMKFNNRWISTRFVAVVTE